MSGVEELKRVIEWRRVKVEKMRKDITQFVGETEELENSLLKLGTSWAPFRVVYLGGTFLFRGEKYIKVPFISETNTNAVCFDGSTKYMDHSTLVEVIE